MVEWSNETKRWESNRLKTFILRVGLVTSLIFTGWSYSNEKASAAMLWPSKCTAFGEAKPGQNPSFQQINCMLTNAALEANIPPEIVKAVATRESGWRQFDIGKPNDGGIGIMQITNQPAYDQQKLQDDITYNIQAGVDILKSMYNRKDLPKIKGVGPDVIENWYFPVMAYNGTKPVNSPLKQSDGTKNLDAYQEKVFTLLEQDSFLNSTKLAQLPFKTSDFGYQQGSSDNIVFNKMVYSLTDQMHASAYFFQKGDKMVVTFDGVKLRSQPNTSSSSTILKTLTKNTTLFINGNFVYDNTASSLNQFVWYPVKTEDQKLAGYISSAYISKKLNAPIVKPVDDNDRYLSGSAQANAEVQIFNGTKLISSAVADANGAFKAAIPVQKAGVQLSIAYKNPLNEQSPFAKIKVTDGTAPTAPVVYKVTNKSTTLSGKTEANASVTAVISGKKYTKAADRYGNIKIVIAVQNSGTKLLVTSKDSAGNVSKASSVLVVRVAPNLPTVNKVRYSSTTVTGKTEKYATVYVKIGSKTYKAKANVKGDYKVSIPKQRTGTKIYVNAKDSKGQVSATKSVIVSK